MKYRSMTLGGLLSLVNLLGIQAEAANTYKTNPAGLAYVYSTGASAYGRAGGMIVTGSCNRSDAVFTQARANGAELMLYLDPVEVTDHYNCALDEAFYNGNRSTVPLWPYPSAGARINYTSTHLTDIRAGSTWSNKVVAYVENIMREGKFDGIFLDVMGARLWTSLANWDSWPQWEKDAWTDGNVDLLRRLDASRRAIRPSFILINNNVWDRGDTRGNAAEKYVDGVVLEHHYATSAYHKAYAGRTFSNLGHRRVFAIGKSTTDAQAWANVQGVTHVSDQQRYLQVTPPVISFSGAITSTTTTTTNIVGTQKKFGTTTVGTTISSGLAADYKRGSRFYLGEKGTLVNFSGYLDGLGGSSGSQAVRVALYRDSNGVPGTLVVQSNTVKIAAGQSAGWVTFPSNSNYKLAAGNYWLLIHSGTTGGVARSRGYTQANWWGNSDSYLDNAAATAGTGSTGTVTVSVNANYTVGW